MHWPARYLFFSYIYSIEASRESESRPTEKAYRRKLNFRDKRIILEAHTNYSLILRLGKYENAVTYSFKIFAFCPNKHLILPFLYPFGLFPAYPIFSKKTFVEKKIPISPMKKRHTHV